MSDTFHMDYLKRRLCLQINRPSIHSSGAPSAWGGRNFCGCIRMNHWQNSGARIQNGHNVTNFNAPTFPKTMRSGLIRMAARTSKSDLPAPLSISLSGLRVNNMGMLRI